MKVNQPTSAPTRKLTAASLTALVVGWGGLVMQNLAPQWYDPSVWVTLTPVAMLVIGYFVRDEDNSPNPFNGGLV